MCGCGWRASVLTDCAQSCPTPCDPVDCSPPSSSVHGIFQARMLEEAAIPFSRGSSRPGDQTCIFCDSGTESGFFFIFIHLFGCVRSYSILRDLLLWLQDSPVAWAQLQVDSSPLSPQGTPHTPQESKHRQQQQGRVWSRRDGSRAESEAERGLPRGRCVWALWRGARGGGSLGKQLLA